MAEIIERRKRHYSGLDADKASIPAGGKEPGDSYFATDKLKLYYWQGGDWKTGLGYEYVPRAVAAFDKDEGDFTRNAAWHVDGLDLSGIVPAGAIAIHVSFNCKGTVADEPFSLRSNATTKGVNYTQSRTQVANVSTETSHGVIYCDADRLIDYYAGANITQIGVAVLGWFV